jgi:hypothetical protein
MFYHVNQDEWFDWVRTMPSLGSYPKSSGLELLSPKIVARFSVSELSPSGLQPKPIISLRSPADGSAFHVRSCTRGPKRTTSFPKSGNARDNAVSSDVSN